jgi:NitT/TauT family transport system substrate-binding protein
MRGQSIVRVVSTAIALYFAVSAALAAETVRIGSTRSLGNAPLLIAQDKGYFADEGLAAQFVYFDAAGPITTGVASGDIDFGATALSGGFFNLASKGELRIIAGFNYDFPPFEGTVFGVSHRARDAGLRSFKDLPGHSVAVTQVGTALHYAVGMIAEKYGFDIKTVRILPLQSNLNSIAALTGGQADVAVMPITYLLPVVKRGDAILLGSMADEKPTQIGAIFISAKAADQHHDMVEHFLRAYRRGAHDYYDAFVGPDGKRRDGPTAAQFLALFAKTTGMTEEQAADSLAYCDPDGRVAVQDVLGQIAWYKSQGMVKPEVDGDAIIDKRFVVPLPPR